MTQNKKRKQSPTFDNNHLHVAMVDDQSIESVLFEEMNRANNQLISLRNKIKLADHKYFLENNGMIDEFIGNMNQFLKDLDYHRNRVSFTFINFDILTHVYQFLTTEELIGCGLVCKLWRESLVGLKVSIQEANICNFLNSSLTKYVSKLGLCDITSFGSLSSGINLNQLKVLDLSNSTLDSAFVDNLRNLQMPRLTKLKLSQVTFNQSDALELLNSNFMSNIKTLDLSYSLNNFTNTFYESISIDDKHLNQITHLKIANSFQQQEKRIELLLKDKVNLEYLSIQSYPLTYCPNLLTNGNYKNLTYLDISRCLIKNQDFANITVSKNLPKLTTLRASSLNWRWKGVDNTTAIFPPNSQSSITELDLCGTNPEQFSSLLDHCPKLEKLTISPETSNHAFQKMMKSPNLKNLQSLVIAINRWNELIENIFISPIYSNLKELLLEVYNPIENMNFISKCTNLINLEILDLSAVEVDSEIVITECENGYKNNPTFSKLKEIHLPSLLEL